MNRKPQLIITVIFFLASLSNAQIRLDQNQVDNDLRTVSGLIKLGEFPRALIFLDRMRNDFGNDNRVLALYKQLYKESKMYSQLENEIRKELSADPLNFLLLTELGEARFLQNDEAGADSIWNSALLSGKQDEAVYRFVAATKLRYGLYEAAIDVYLKGRITLGKTTLFSMELASIYEAQRNYPKAVDEYLIQLSDEPQNISFITTRIRGLLEDADDSLQIIKIVAQRAKESPDRPEFNEVLGDLYIKLNQMDKALECYKTIGARQNDDGQALVRFAGRAFESKAYATAINAADEYLRTSKKNTFKDMALLIRAKSQLASGQTASALANLRELASNALDYRIRDEAGFTCGLIYAQDKNDCDSAITIWDSALQSSRDPGLQSKTRIEMAVCYLKMDDFDKAGNLLKLVLSNKVSDVDVEKANFLLGDIQFYEGKIDDAGNSFKNLVKQFPQGDYSNDALIRIGAIGLAGQDDGGRQALARFALAMKSQVLGRSLESAQILSDSSFVSSPIAEQALFYSGMAFSQAARRDDALMALKKYIALFPDGFYIDRAYLQLGDLFSQDPATYPDAKSAYGKILETFPDGPVTESARERLQQLNSPEKIG